MFYLTGAPVLMASRREPPPTTPRAPDSPSGELFSRSLPTDALPLSPFRRMPGVLLDTHVPSRSQVREMNFNINLSMIKNCSVWTHHSPAIISYDDRFYFSVTLNSILRKMMILTHGLSIILSTFFTTQALCPLSSLRSSWTVTTTSRELLKFRRKYLLPSTRLCLTTVFS